MSGMHRHFVAIGSDPLDDPLNLGWDAVVRNHQPASPGVDPDDFDLLRRVHAHANRELPSEDFFDELEHQLVRMYRVPTPEPAAPPRAGSAAAEVRSSPRARVRPHVFSNRYAPFAGALAVLAVLLVAGLAVLLRAAPGISEPPPIPASLIREPVIEPAVQFDFDPGMLDVPGATTWTDMLVCIEKFDPGTPFTTSVGMYLTGDGPLIVMVLDGELEVTPAGTAYVHRAGSDPSVLQRIEAGQLLTLGPRDTIIYSTQEGANGVTSADTPTIAFVGQVHGPGDVVAGPEAYNHGATEMVGLMYNGYPFPVLPSDSAAISVRRLQLLPFDSFVIDPPADLRYVLTYDPAAASGLRVYDGAVSTFPPTSGHAAWKLQDLGPGPHTLFNLGSEPVDIYFLVLEGAPATPSP